MAQAADFDFDFFEGEVTEELLKQIELTDVLPEGRTLVQMNINEESKGEHWIEIQKFDEYQQLCVSANLQQLTAIKAKYFTHKEKLYCLSDSDEFIVFSYSSSTQSVNVQVPQKYQIDYNRNWLPEEHWSNGDNTSFVNYKLNVSDNYTDNEHTSSYNALLSAGGTLGSVHAYVGGTLNEDNQQLSDAYLFRDIGSQSRMKVGSISSAGNFGGTSLNSIIGASLNTDPLMKPPSMRNYTQQFTGVANSNATIIFYNESGNQIALESVSAGPYSIPLGGLPYGRLTVEVDEAGSGVKTYVVYNRNTSFLLSANSYELNLVAGVDEDRDIAVTAGEWRYGLSDTYSAASAWVAANDYQQLTVSGAANFNEYGTTSLALSTLSSRWDDDHLTTPIRLQLDYQNEIIKDVTLNAFLQTSPEGYLNYTDLNAASSSTSNVFDDPVATRIKQSEYNLTLSTTLTKKIGLNVRAYGEYFLDKRKSTGVGIYSTYDVNLFKTRANFSLSLDSSREETRYESTDDYSITLTMSIPLSDTANTTFTFNSGKDYSNADAYYNVNDGDINYQVGVGTDSNSNTKASAYAQYERGWGAVSGDVYVDESTTRLGADVEGSLVFINDQAVLTPWFRPPVAIIDMNGAEGVTLGNNISNSQGIVVTDLTPYSPTKLSVDVDNLPSNTYVSAQTINLVAREGAIIRANMSGVRQGRNILLTLSPAPALATPVVDTAGKEYGWVSENGELYLAAFPLTAAELSAGECQFSIPEMEVEQTGLHTMAIDCR
ncbi:fimbrial biogenesis outer membrane usher protein [Shewanella sp. VB17]|uniref:fimbria/pilus outer membrane usher protein n=1 Tax=Shewanella sp. VB17 TaxID=2739432 RepID=UPI00156329DC|nr:fimbria/pilus outer membrane usher protein [Shewanella sp. VB17]NRD74182.1 fimbrial biogenesis outer membrane usher protein [Shewanella sp. VB17]